MTDVDDLPFLRKQARTQRFTLGAPKEFRVAPDASRVLFLRAESGTDPRHSLWSADLATGAETKLVDAAELLPGEEELPAEERARRERARETGGGVVHYGVDAGFTVAAFSLSGKLHTLDLATGEVTLRVDGAVIDPRPNPTGTHVAYVQNRRLHVMELATGEDRVLVEEDGEDIAWGLAEFIAAEEMDRTRGYWWAPDGRSILAERSDRGPVPRWTIADPANPQHPANVVAYPAAGTTNALVSLAVLGLDGSRVDVAPGEWEYLASVHWSAGGAPLLAVEPRDQKRMDVLALDVADGSTSVLHTAADQHWIDIVGGVPAWTPDGRLVTEGMVDGDHRLFVGGEAVTPAGLQLRAVLDVGDEILFSASEADPTQIHVFRTEGGSIRRLSTVDGVHHGAGSAAVTVLSSWSLEHSGPRVSVLRDGSEAASIAVVHCGPGHRAEPDLADAGGARPARGAAPAARVRAERRQAAGAARPVRRAARPARAAEPQRVPDVAVAGRPGVRGARRGRPRHAGPRRGVGARDRRAPRRRHPGRTRSTRSRRRPRSSPSWTSSGSPSAAGPTAGTCPRWPCCGARTSSTRRSRARRSPTGRCTTPTTPSATSASRRTNPRATRTTR